MAGGDQPAATELRTQPAHGRGQASIRYAQKTETEWMLLSCGNDGKLLTSSTQDLSSLGSYSNPGGEIYSCDINAESDLVAFAESEYFKLLKFPSFEDSKIVARCELPGRTVAFNSTGKLLAVAGDDNIVRLVDVEPLKNRFLKGEEYVRCVSFDPDSEFLACSHACGTLVIWDVKQSDKPLKIHKHACPKLDYTSPSRNGVSWHPDGSVLAVPGTNNDAVLYERLSWKRTEDFFDGHHTAPVNLVLFSPNGLYLMTAGQDKMVVVWEVKTKTPVVKAKLTHVVSGAAWHPQANELSVVTENGELGTWKDVIPESQFSPFKPWDELAKEVAAEAAREAAVREAAEQGLTVDDEALDDMLDDDEGVTDVAQVPRRKSAAHVPYRVPVGPPVIPPQGPIQSGATPWNPDDSSRFLLYNTTGYIIQRAGDAHSTIEVQFHDTMTFRRRPSPLTDLFGINMGSFSDRGAFYAAPVNPEMDNKAPLVFRAFEAWAANSDWHVLLPEGEEAVCIATGSCFAAAATNQQLLRIYSIEGVQKAVISLPSAAVALAAHGSRLAVVHHGTQPWSNGSQNLTYAVYDIHTHDQLYSGTLTLSQGSKLTWLGFSSEGILAAADSEGIMRIRGPEYGGSWVPVFDAKQKSKQGEVYWPVGLSLEEQKLSVVVCSPQQPHPKVDPRPVMQQEQMKLPLADNDKEGPAIEQTLILRQAQFRNQEFEVQIASASGMDAMEEQQVLQSMRVAIDKTLLTLYHNSLKHNRFAQALHIAEQLNMMKSLQGAIALAHANNAHSLSAHLSNLMAARLDTENERQKRVMAEEASTPEGHRQHANIVATPGHTPAPPSLPLSNIDSNASLPATASLPAEDVGGTKKRKLTQSSGGAGGNPFARKKSARA